MKWAFLQMILAFVAIVVAEWYRLSDAKEPHTKDFSKNM